MTHIFICDCLSSHRSPAYVWHISIIWEEVTPFDKQKLSFVSMNWVYTGCKWLLFSAFKTFRVRNIFDYNNAVETVWSVSSHPVSEETVWNVSGNNKALLYRTSRLEQNRPESCNLLELKIICTIIFDCPLKKISFLLSFGVWILGV